VSDLGNGAEMRIVLGAVAQPVNQIGLRRHGGRRAGKDGRRREVV
jgi:hypothetical protein